MTLAKKLLVFLFLLTACASRSVAVGTRAIRVTDDDKDEKKTLVKHKGKKFTDLTQAEKDELLLALLQRMGMANKNGRIKSN